VTAEPGVNPFLRVTVGSVVATRDGQKAGKVKETSGQYLKVETSFLQRDYWLPATSVESAVPGDRVVLAVDGKELSSLKLFKLPE
jgi:hypothetical protein